MEAKESNLMKSKKSLQNQIDELNNQLETITSEKNTIHTQLKGAKSELETLNEELEMVSGEDVIFQSSYASHVFGFIVIITHTHLTVHFLEGFKHYLMRVTHWRSETLI